MAFPLVQYESAPQLLFREAYMGPGPEINPHPNSRSVLRNLSPENHVIIDNDIQTIIQNLEQAPESMTAYRSEQSEPLTVQQIFNEDIHSGQSGHNVRSIRICLQVEGNDIKACIRFQVAKGDDYQMLVLRGQMVLQEEYTPAKSSRVPEHKNEIAAGNVLKLGRRDLVCCRKDNISSWQAVDPLEVFSPIHVYRHLLNNLDNAIKQA